jgi:hypothetical protein
VRAAHASGLPRDCGREHALRMTAAEIAAVLGMALSTVSAVLLRIGLGKRHRQRTPARPPPTEGARSFTDEFWQFRSLYG